MAAITDSREGTLEKKTRIDARTAKTADIPAAKAAAKAAEKVAAKAAAKAVAKAAATSAADGSR